MKLFPTKKYTIILGGEPRADLLPPETHAKERVAATRKVFAIVIAFVIVVAAGGTGIGFLRGADAQEGLAAEQATAATKASERTKYLEATKLNTLVASSKDARTVGVSTEVLWADLYSQIQKSLPGGVSITSMAMTGRAPWTPPTPGGGFTPGSRVASVALVVSSRSVIDQTTLVRSFSSLPGYSGASISSVVQVSDVYSMTVALVLSTGALSGRFPIETAKVTK